MQKNIRKNGNLVMWGDRSGNRIERLTPEQVQYSKEMGMSIIEYAKFLYPALIKVLEPEFSLEEIELAEKIILDLG